MFAGLHRPGFPSSARNSLHLRAYPVQWYRSLGADIEEMPALRRQKQPVDSVCSCRQMITSVVAGIRVYSLCCPQQLDNNNVFETRFFCAHTSLKLASKKEFLHPCFVWFVPIINSLEKGLAEGPGMCKCHPTLANAASVLASCGKTT